MFLFSKKREKFFAIQLVWVRNIKTEGLISFYTKIIKFICFITIMQRNGKDFFLAIECIYNKTDFLFKYIDEHHFNFVARIFHWYWFSMFYFLSKIFTIYSHILNFFLQILFRKLFNFLSKIIQFYFIYTNKNSLFIRNSVKKKFVSFFSLNFAY